MVLAIMGILTVVTLPTFVRSLRGNRLRTAARSVVMAGRYARSMAVMKQRDMTLTFDLEQGQVRVDAVVVGAPKPEEDSGENAPDGLPGYFARDDLVPEDDQPITVQGQELTRRLDRAHFEYVDINGEDRRYSEGRCSVLYRSNGTCTPYEVGIADEQGGAVVVEVDALSSAQTRGE